MANLQGNGGTISVGGIELGQVQSWEIAQVSVPMADIAALDRLASEIGRPFDAPSVCDLSSDPLACAILRCWARQPWAEVHRCALIDRMIELGHEDRWKWAEPMVQAHVPWVVLAMKLFPRRCARYRLQIWKLRLQDAFGRFE